jgi:hypothetical protein
VMELSMALTAGEADKALAAAKAAAMPLLRACKQPELVALVRQSLGLLHVAACAASDPSAALQQALSSVRELGKAVVAAAPAPEEPTAAAAPAEPGTPAPLAAAAGGKRKPPESMAAAPSAKQARCDEAAQQQRAWLEQEPCGGCGDPAGEQVLCDFCMASWHLGCCCPSLEAVPFLGQLSYWAQGRLSLQFQDGEVWTGLTALQGSGKETLEGYRLGQVDAQDSQRALGGSACVREQGMVGGC